MKLSGALGRTLVLAAVAVAAAYYLVSLLVGTGVKLPFTESTGYTVSFQTDDVDNLVPYTDVQVAGIRVGKVQGITNEAGHATVTMSLDSSVAPLHSGMALQIGAKSVVGESYVNLRDGTGPEVESGYVVPAESVKPAVQLGDVLRSLDPKTLEALRSMSRSLGGATAGTKDSLSNVMTGLGKLGDNGHTALDALAAQSKDLTAVSQEATKILAALNTGEGQISTLVRNAQQLTESTAGQAESLEDTMRRLPATLSSACPRR